MHEARAALALPPMQANADAVWRQWKRVIVVLESLERTRRTDSVISHVLLEMLAALHGTLLQLRDDIDKDIDKLDTAMTSVWQHVAADVLPASAFIAGIAQELGDFLDVLHA